MRRRRRVRETGSEQRGRPPLPRVAGFVGGVIGVAAANAILWAGRSGLDAAHASLLYLLTVALVAYSAGSGPAILSAFVSFVSWNYFFIEPTGTLYVHDPRDLIALTTFLAVALLIGELSGRTRDQAAAARERERETAMLYDISMAISAEPDASRVLPAVLARVVHATRARAAIVLAPDEHGNPVVVARHPDGEGSETDARWCEHAGEVLETGTPRGLDPSGGTDPVTLPLQSGDRVAGVLVLVPGASRGGAWRQQRRLLLGAASHVAIALERQRLSVAAAQAEALRAAEQFRNTLLSSVSHDLRTPLSSIKAAVTALLHADGRHSPVGRRDLLDAINEEADRLDRFVGELLDMSRLEAGAWRPEKDWFDLTDILGTVLGRLDEEAGARVRLEVPPDLPMIPVDSVQIGQALWNVLENALKFSPTGQPVTVEAQLAEPDTLRIAISDRGPGIPPGEEERIFEKFYRAAGDRRRSRVPGAGLGLAIARGIVEAHGGSIQARARRGGGAVFEILLPLRPPDMDEPPVVEEEQAHVGADAHGG